MKNFFLLHDEQLQANVDVFHCCNFYLHCFHQVKSSDANGATATTTDPYQQQMEELLTKFSIFDRTL